MKFFGIETAFEICNFLFQLLAQRDFAYPEGMPQHTDIERLEAQRAVRGNR
jgi:hypothetical protein